MVNGVADGAPVHAAPAEWCPAPYLHSQAGGQESCVALLQAAWTPQQLPSALQTWIPQLPTSYVIRQKVFQDCNLTKHKLFTFHVNYSGQTWNPKRGMRLWYCAGQLTLWHIWGNNGSVPIRITGGILTYKRCQTTIQIICSSAILSTTNLTLLILCSKKLASNFMSMII